MLNKIKRQECLKKYPCFPLRSYDYEKDEDLFYYPETFKSYILTLSSKSFRGHIRRLGEAILTFSKQLGSDHLIFLGDTELSWLYQENDYKPADEAYQYLVDNKLGKRFNGALQVNNPELVLFVKHLSWLIRCNGSLPYIYFTDKEQNFIGTICKYGNIHIDTMNDATDKMFNAFVAHTEFSLISGNECFNQFGTSSAIAGRHTKMK